MSIRRKSLSCAFLLTLAATAAATNAEAKKAWVFFSFTGANLAQPVAISGHNHIVGSWVSYSPYQIHAFVRTPDGQVTTIDPPGTVQVATAMSVALDGTIGGYYGKSSDNLVHGFIRDPAGNYQDVDVPGSSATSVMAINDAGFATGSWDDGAGGSRGFVRRPDGSIVSFAPPGSTLVNPVAINNKQQIAGTLDGSHGFLRQRNGTITTFNVAGAALTTVSGMNDAGVIVGNYQAHQGDLNSHGFLRATDGTIATFDVSGAGVATAQSTLPTGINYLGEIVGCYVDTSNAGHSFVREPDGSFKQLDASGGLVCATAIGADGKIVGFSVNANTAFRLNRKEWKGE